MDAIAYPHAPSPYGAERHIISFEAVEIAGNGFNCLGKCPWVDRVGRSVGKREVTVGWIVRRGGSAYVDVRGERWQMRENG